MTRQSLSRRRFLQATSLSGGALALAHAHPAEAIESQTPLNVRPDVATLSPNDPLITAYKAGVAAMKAMDPSQPKSWTAQANIHNNFCPHGNWFFLPWHRAYLYYFEQICREASGNNAFVLPYWNWSTTPRLPAVFWGDDNTLYDSTRQIDPNDPADPGYVAPSVLESILQISDFQLFGSFEAPQQRPDFGPQYGQLEQTPHNYIHGWINGDMGAFLSPLDPIFWLHHCNIDRLWADWTRRHPGQMPGDSSWTDYALNQFTDLSGAPVTRKVSEMLSTYTLGYRYDTQPEVPQALVLAAARAPVTVPETLRSEVTVTQAATFSAPLTVSLPLTPALRTRVMAAPSLHNLPPGAAPAKQTLRLALEGIVPPKDSRVAIRVFLNQPKADARTPIDGPTYLSTATFFNADHGGDGHAAGAARGGHAGPSTVNFFFNVDDAINRLARAGLHKDNEAMQVSVVPVPIGPKAPQSVSITLSRIRLWAV
jgi:hypothetical protein